MYKTFIEKKNILLICFALLLVLSAGLFFGLSSTKKASADADDVYTEWNYAETSNGYFVDFYGVSDLVPEINNSSAVLSRTYSFRISGNIYEQLSSGYNHLVVCWGRKAEMDILASACLDDSSSGDPDFWLNSDVVMYHGLFSDTVASGGNLSRNWILYSNCPSFATFPYVGYRIQQSDIWAYPDYDEYMFMVDVTWAEGNLFDIGIFITYQYSTSFNEDNRVNAYFTDSTIVSSAEYKVQHAGSYHQNTVGACEKALGIYTGSGYTRVEYSYVVMEEGDHWNKYKTVKSAVSIPSVYVPDEDFVRNAIYQSYSDDGLSAFNVVYSPQGDGTMKDGSYQSVDVFGGRDVREAVGFNYTYSFKKEGGGYNSIPSDITGSCILYNDYLYRDFFVRIANMGDLAEQPENYFDNNLYVDVYYTSREEKNGKMYLYYDYDTIFTLFDTTLGWMVQREDFSLEVLGDYDRSHVTVEELTDNTGKVTCLAVSFGYNSFSRLSNEKYLAGLEIVGLVPITKPFEVDVTVEYIILTEDLKEVSSSFVLPDRYWTAGPSSVTNKLSNLKNELTLENGYWAGVIYGSIQPSVLNGIKYMYPSSVIETSLDKETETCTLRIIYSYNTSLLVIRDDVFEWCKVVTLPGAFPICSLDLLKIKQYLPYGYRIGQIVNMDGLVSIEEDLGNPLNTTFRREGQTRKEPYRMTVRLTDKWPVNITYYERFNNSPFFVKTVVEKQLRVADYDIFALTADIVANILGKETLNLFELSMVEHVDVNYRAETYFVTLDYSPASLRGKDYNGNDDEIKVPLTCYADWTASFGKDWSVMMLNDTANHYFKNTDGIKPDMLYGFFSVAVFEERVTDLNYWFQSYSANGCKTCFTSKEVKGSEIYQFFGNWDTVLRYPCMAFCELFNKDDAMYYSYFFYMDGSTDLSFLAINGADSYDDNDSALENKVHDVGESVGGFFSSAWDKIKNSTAFKIVLIVIAAIVCIIVLSLVIKLVMLIFRRRN